MFSRSLRCLLPSLRIATATFVRAADTNAPGPVLVDDRFKLPRGFHL